MILHTHERRLSRLTMYTQFPCIDVLILIILILELSRRVTLDVSRTLPEVDDENQGNNVTLLKYGIWDFNRKELVVEKNMRVQRSFYIRLIV